VGVLPTSTSATSRFESASTKPTELPAAASSDSTPPPLWPRAKKGDRDGRSDHAGQRRKQDRAATQRVRLGDFRRLERRKLAREVSDGELEEVLGPVDVLQLVGEMRAARWTPKPV
jgi:hypothetical protein